MPESIEVFILNDQGGSVMDVSEDVTATLRAQDHGHPPVVCFIPYGSRLGFHENGVASTMANIDYKFPQCVCYEVQDE